MMFAAPLALLGLLALPGILLLLRLNPPPARRIRFPPVALLKDLALARQTPRQVPLWLLILRVAAALCIILGLAGPSRHPPPSLPGSGPILLVIDNGFAAAPDWPARRAAARAVIASASQADRGIAILATASGASGVAPHILGVMAASNAAQLIDALQPEPWPTDRIAATAALLGAAEHTRIYIADGITDGPGFADFMKALAPDRIIAADALPPVLLPLRLAADGSLLVKVLNPPAGSHLLARSSDGAILANTPVSPRGDTTVALPLPLANKVSSLALDGPPTAGGTLLLDGSARASLVGLAAGSPNAETPYLGPLYFIRRALPAGAQTVTGNIAHLIDSKANIIVLADTSLDPAQQIAVRNFINAGGVVVRFAGPITGAAPDPVTPDPLLPGDRRLGGALTWASPQTIASFPENAAFAGLPVDQSVKISRQMLADPTLLVPATIWASLTDGTPLVLGTRMGKGYLIACLTTANADWSNLALSGLLPEMMNRLVAMAQGTAPPPNAALPLQTSLSAFGDLIPASGAASLVAGHLPGMAVSPAQPPGLYGNADAAIALNLGGHIPPPTAAKLPGATALDSQVAPVNFGPYLLAIAILLLAFDLAVSLGRRGLLTFRRLAAGIGIILFIPAAAHAQHAALQPTLGYILTGDPANDQIAADGLAYLSADVSAHTSAQLANPVGLNPATDDLTLYPLIYWLVATDAAAPPLAACNALNAYMQHGGLLVIDTPGGDADAPGSGAGFAPGAGAAIARVTACLALPPLTPLTTADVLTHCFYIIQSFPGRFAGAPVLVAATAARDADGVTPVIISQNDWAGAWARDANGDPEQTPIPDGIGQRIGADRLGTNLVIYALTGSYKADQSNIPSLLDKLGD